MNIGQAAKASGISAKMICYYESIDLLPAPGRRESGYREYSPDDIHRLRFVRRARELGFSLERIQALLQLWSDHDRSDADVRQVALDHIAELEAKAAELQEMIGTLRHLASACKEGGRPLCPIIGALGGGIADAPPPPVRDRRRGREAM